MLMDTLQLYVCRILLHSNRQKCCSAVNEVITSTGGIWTLNVIVEQIAFSPSKEISL